MDRGLRGVYASIVFEMYDRGGAVFGAAKDLGRMCGTNSTGWTKSRDMLVADGKLYRVECTRRGEGWINLRALDEIASQHIAAARRGQPPTASQLANLAELMATFSRLSPELLATISRLSPELLATLVKKPNENSGGKAPISETRSQRSEVEDKPPLPISESSSSSKDVIDDDDGFERLWDAYPVEAGSQIGPARSQWQKLDAHDRQLALANVANVPTAGAPYLAVWLGGEFRKAVAVPTVVSVDLPPSGPWRNLCDEVITKHGTAVWSSWLGRCDADGRTLTAPSQFIRSRILDQHGVHIAAHGFILSPTTADGRHAA